MSEKDAKKATDVAGAGDEEVVIHKLVLKKPKSSDRGYLRRQRLALDFSGKLEAMDVSQKVVDEMISFLLPYVEEPEDRDDAREALEWASEDEVMGLLKAISGSSVTGPNRRRSAR